MKVDHLLQEHGFRPRDVLDGLSDHGLRQEADEVAGMTSLEGCPNLAVGFEAANARAMPGTWIDDNERPALRIYFYVLRRDDPGQNIVDRAIQRPPIDKEFRLKFENVRGNSGQVLAILIATLAHHIEKQRAPLRSVNDVIDAVSEATEAGDVGAIGVLTGWHFNLRLVVAASPPFQGDANVAGHSAGKIHDLNAELVF